MTTPWIGANTAPSETAQAIADALRASHDPVAIAQAALAKRAANAAIRDAAMAAAVPEYDPRTSAEKVAGVPHDYAYDDPRAKRFMPSQLPGPRDKEQDAEAARMKSMLDDHTKKMLDELDLTPAQRIKMERIMKAKALGQDSPG